MLKADDLVGVSFIICSYGCIYSLSLEGNVLQTLADFCKSCWSCNLNRCSLLLHESRWIQTGENPNVYRYIDWLLTVPLQMVEFYLILAAVGAATAGMFWRLLIGTLVMLIAGFLGENGSINATVGFIVGMAGWIYILYEVFAGEAAQANASSNSKAQQSAYNAMKWIVSIGWSIYPIGYFLGYLAGGTDENALMPSTTLLTLSTR